jgi:hypothetical protein
VATVDRRSKVDTITFRNRRFGGDRRKIIRRKADREKLFEKSS